MTALVVDRCGPGASVQDGGRVGWRRFGVSGAGAMDRLALAVANALVGNAPGTAAVELTLAGARFRVEGGPVLVAASGPGVTLTIDGRVLAPGVSAKAAEMVEVSAIRGGVYGYLAVAGGFDLRPEMGSRSVHLRSGIGGAMLAPGARLPVAGGSLMPLALDRVPDHGAGPIRFMPGPQDDWFGPEALEMLAGTEWQVDARSDRMGRFLAGPAMAPRAGSMVSDGVLPGAIQVPPAGQPIILMRDCQTTGGYPKIATVISADLDRLSQMPAGARFRLVPVDRATAVAAAQRLAQAIVGLSPRPASGVDTARLLAVNLIGGVVDARADRG
ncbi:biotin-dependent carboxyltransferase family protein [Gemmobacter sp.]|uniref:5-oxoprolinase subunit C family protein n=1 Tax=Gemmobacter sp. TaxID=1898957 RepID=UPI002AFF5DB6|nr:biotin-dependent carboxyltransferase family protein [Gemmobacter sp.]